MRYDLIEELLITSHPLGLYRGRPAGSRRLLIASANRFSWDPQALARNVECTYILGAMYDDELDLDALQRHLLTAQSGLKALNLESGWLDREEFKEVWQAGEDWVLGKAALVSVSVRQLRTVTVYGRQEKETIASASRHLFIEDEGQPDEEIRGALESIVLTELPWFGPLREMLWTWEEVTPTALVGGSSGPEYGSCVAAAPALLKSGSVLALLIAGDLPWNVEVQGE